MTAHILVLNFNGRELLEKYLPSLAEARERSKFECRLTVIDNASTDDSIDYLKGNFPTVGIYRAKENKVLCSYNEAAAAFEDDILLFMNNDIRVEPGFADPLVEPFLKDPDVFFVTPQCLSPVDHAYEGNKTKGMIRRGVFWASALYPGYQADIAKRGTTLQGGFGAFDRRKFLEIGGYDDLYLPGHLEDTDLCFRAYKRDWKCLYEPASVVYHEGAVSFKKRFGSRGVHILNWRNTFLFMWKNLSDKMNFFKFLIWLPLRAAWALVMFQPEFLIGLWQALGLYKEAMKRRDALKKAGWLDTVPDTRIFELSCD